MTTNDDMAGNKPAKQPAFAESLAPEMRAMAEANLESACADVLRELDEYWRTEGGAESLRLPDADADSA